MKYRQLGKTDMRVSVIGIGTWQLGGEWGKTFEQAEVDAMFEKAAELGINLIDTAECYGDHLSEKLIGRAIKDQRDKWVIATKFGHRFKPFFERDNLFEPAQVQKQLEESLRSLQTDYVDLYQFHSGTDEIFDTPGLWEMLQKQVEAGKVRHLGISISQRHGGIYQVDKASEVGAEAVQVVYNRIHRNPETQIFDSCIRQNLGVLARVPLASGFLSGNYSRDAKFASSDVRSVWRDENERCKVVEEVARIKSEVPEGVPMARWALAWGLRHPGVTCVIPGCKNIEQVESNAMAADIPDVKDNHPQGVLDKRTFET
ncbi:MAG: aldo/keto reductase [Planctomycetota bacterium]|jgi:aryl-alcohol dehydrogenase-like predicted oxidoreductase